MLKDRPIESPERETFPTSSAVLAVAPLAESLFKSISQSPHLLCVAVLVPLPLSWMAAGRNDFRRGCLTLLYRVLWFFLLLLLKGVADGICFRAGCTCRTRTKSGSTAMDPPSCFRGRFLPTAVAAAEVAEETASFCLMVLRRRAIISLRHSRAAWRP